jgi:hypothetical protein
MSSRSAALALVAAVMTAASSASSEPAATPPPTSGDATNAAEACTPITSVPFTIAAPGRYCLTADLKLRPNPSFGMRLNAPAAIKVLANDVTIDFQGHTLDDVTNGIATNALAIRAYNRKRVTVTNGTIMRYFIAVAIVGDTSEDITVEHMRFERVRYAAVSLNKVKNYAVRGNLLSAMGHGNAWYMPHAILASGTGTIAANVIEGVIPNEHKGRTATEAISVKDGEVTIDGNTIVNPSMPDGESYGINVLKGATATITRNKVANFKYPVTYTPMDGTQWSPGDNVLK